MKSIMRVCIKSDRMRYLVWLYIVSVAILLLYPFSKVGASNPIGMGELGDYIAHFLIFLPWMFGGWLVWRDRLHKIGWFIVGVIFIATLEILQLTSEYRGFNIYDIVVGEIGLVCSYVLLCLSQDRLELIIKKIFTR